jgi:hypothetical protein
MTNGQNASWKLVSNDRLVENRRVVTNDEIHALKGDNLELKRMVAEQMLKIKSCIKKV